MEYGKLQTELRNPRTMHIDRLDTLEMLRCIHEEDRRAVEAVGAVLPQIAPVIDRIAAGMKQGGRLIYTGCGTSGRLGVIGTNSRNMQVINNHIHDCSVGGVEFSQCQDVRVDGNTFENLGDEWNEAPIFRIYGGENMTCNGEDVIKKFGNG